MYLYYTILYHTIRYDTILYYTILYYTILSYLSISISSIYVYMCIHMSKQCYRHSSRVAEVCQYTIHSSIHLLKVNIIPIPVVCCFSSQPSMRFMMLKNSWKLVTQKWVDGQVHIYIYSLHSMQPCAPARSWSMLCFCMGIWPEIPNVPHEGGHFSCQYLAALCAIAKGAGFATWLPPSCAAAVIRVFRTNLTLVAVFLYGHMARNTRCPTRGWALFMPVPGCAVLHSKRRGICNLAADFVCCSCDWGFPHQSHNTYIYIYICIYVCIYVCIYI